MVSWWNKFQDNFSVAFLFCKLQFQESYKAALTPKYLIPATLRQIHNPYFTILKSITTNTFAMQNFETKNKKD